MLDGATLEEAMAFSITHPGPIHLVLSDVVMPRGQRSRDRRLPAHPAAGDQGGLHVGLHRRGDRPARRARPRHPLPAETLQSSKALRIKLRAVLDTPEPAPDPLLSFSAGAM